MVQGVYFIRMHFYEFRRQIERSKLAREKQLRETAEREKSMLEQKLQEFQEEIRMAKEALVRDNDLSWSNTRILYFSHNSSL